MLISRATQHLQRLAIAPIACRRMATSHSTPPGSANNTVAGGANAGRQGFNVHQVAQSGFGEGTNDLYDRARPTYPASALQAIHSTLHGNNDPHRPLNLLEPGSGTGIFTRLLLSPPPPAAQGPTKDAPYPTFNIGKLVGIEPSSGMRSAWHKGLARIPKDQLEKSVDGSKRMVGVVDGAFDDFSNAAEYGVKKGEVDGVLIAQAWHWCPDHDKALREIAAHLRPSAPLILVWNLEPTSSHISSTVRHSIYEPYELGTPQYHRGLWRSMFDVPAYNELFEPPQEASYAWSLGMTEESLVDRVFSKSYLTEKFLSGDKRVEFEQNLRKIIREHPKVWIDEEKGIFEYQYNTDVVICRRKAA